MARGRRGYPNQDSSRLKREECSRVYSIVSATHSTTYSASDADWPLNEKRCRQRPTKYGRRELDVDKLHKWVAGSTTEAAWTSDERRVDEVDEEEVEDAGQSKENMFRHVRQSRQVESELCCRP